MKSSETALWKTSDMNEILLTSGQNDPNGMFVDSNGTYHLYYQCEASHSHD